MSKGRYNDTVIYEMDINRFMAALLSRSGHYISALCVVSSAIFLSIFLLSSPNLSGRRLDVYHTCTHGVALVRT